ncbi:NAD(+)/NADH kinase [Brevibacterium casei]|nr:NAD(+)/NADH kinase [Brevibacterium casei]
MVAHPRVPRHRRRRLSPRRPQRRTPGPAPPSSLLEQPCPCRHGGSAGRPLPGGPRHQSDEGQCEEHRGDGEGDLPVRGVGSPLIFETTLEDAGEGAANEALEAGVDVVIAAGGDGTIRAVASALTGTATPMGIIPMGTGNLLARNLDLVLDKPEWAIRIALWGRNRDVDVGVAQISRRGDRHVFMVMTGLGFDAEVMAKTTANAKSRLGWLAYLEAGSRTLVGRPSHVKITYDDDYRVSARVRSVIGGNCGKLQGGIQPPPRRSSTTASSTSSSSARRTSANGWVSPPRSSAARPATACTPTSASATTSSSNPVTNSRSSSTGTPRARRSTSRWGSCRRRSPSRCRRPISARRSGPKSGPCEAGRPRSEAGRRALPAARHLWVDTTRR